MSTEEQAEAYLTEAELTLESARAIYTSATEENRELWADVVKNGYDAIEQAASAGIAHRDESIPRRHPEKINKFLTLFSIEEELEEALLNWLSRRSSSQYVDIRGNRINVPHQQFNRQDAEKILEDAEQVINLIEHEIQD